MTEYIERDKACAIMQQLEDEDFELYGVKIAEGFDGERAISALKSIKAADVRPVVRGKWKHGVCQTCFYDWSEVTPFASVPNFCPHCGADMRGGNKWQN